MPKPETVKNVEDLEFEVRFYEGIVKRSPNYIEALIPLAEAYTRAGYYSKGLAVDQKLCRLCPDDPTAHYNLGCSYALIGEKQKALEALEKSIDLGYREGEHMKNDLDLKCLFAEPAFLDLLKRIKAA